MVGEGKIQKYEYISRLWLKVPACPRSR